MSCSSEKRKSCEEIETLVMDDNSFFMSLRSRSLLSIAAGIMDSSEKYNIYARGTKGDTEFHGIASILISLNSTVVLFLVLRERSYIYYIFRRLLYIVAILLSMISV